MFTKETWHAKIEKKQSLLTKEFEKQRQCDQLQQLLYAWHTVKLNNQIISMINTTKAFDKKNFI